MSSQIKVHPTEELRQEHRAVLKLLNDLNGVIASAEAMNAGSWKPSFENGLAFFNRDVAIHFKKEEDALFPAMEKYLGREGGPIAVMLNEHKQHNSLLRELGGAIAAGNLAVLRSTWESFYSLLTMHILKEDSVLFPMAERLLVEGEWIEVAQKMDELKKA
ncbi:MAG: hemerythrin domain-containing protein [Terriglobia bacterium]